MKKTLLATLLVTASSIGTVFAADMAVKAPPAPVAVANPWDLAFGAGVYSNYVFRGISQSNNGPSVNAYFEPRYNVSPNLQLYGGVGGWSIDFANRPTAEIDIYGGIRPTFGPLAFDFGVWYYWYPKGECYNANVVGECALNGNILPNSANNFIKDDLSFLEYFAKVTWNVNDNVALGAAYYYDDNWLNFGFDAQYLSGTLKLTAPSSWLPSGFGLYASGEIGHYWLGTTDSFYGFGTATPNGVTLPDYTTWNVGIGLTYSVFTVDLRYSDSDLNEVECNAITSDFNAHQVSPGVYGSKWCGQAYVVSLKADLTYGSNVK